MHSPFSIPATIRYGSTAGRRVFSCLWLKCYRRRLRERKIMKNFLPGAFWSPGGISESWGGAYRIQSEQWLLQTLGICLIFYFVGGNTVESFLEGEGKSNTAAPTKPSGCPNPCVHTGICSASVLWLVSQDEAKGEQSGKNQGKRRAESKQRFFPQISPRIRYLIQWAADSASGPQFCSWNAPHQ